MAIFAKKKDGRRQNQGAGDEAPPNESVHIEIPDRHANDGVLTKANLPAAEAQGDPRTGAKVDTQTASTPEVTGQTTGEVASPKDQTTAAELATAAGAAPAGEAEPLEPVDIEPEVIEAPAEAPLVFGIADAIRLMRSLPADPNIDLVVRVVRVTLSAVNVSVDDIMRDAEKKEAKVRDSIAALENEVADLEKTLQDRRAAIAAHQADLRETATVRERLHMADKYTPHPPPLPPGAARVPLPKPREWDSFDADVPFKDSTKDT